MDNEQILHSRWSPEEIEKEVKEAEVDIKKMWYDFAVTQLKRGGVNLESSDFIAEHGVGFVVRLKRIIDEIWSIAAIGYRKSLEARQTTASFDSRYNIDEPLAEFFSEYSIDYMSAMKLLKKGESHDSEMYKNIMKKLCKQLLSTEQIKEDDFDPSMLKE